MARRTAAEGDGPSEGDKDEGDGPVLVISDLHGNLALLRRALEDGAKLAGRSDLTVVLLGDYCDNGPETPALLDFLCDAMDGGGSFGQMRLVPIIGNHDMACLLNARPGVFGSPSGTDWWRKWHAFWNDWENSTPGNYGLRWGCGAEAFRERFPERHRLLLEGLPWCAEIGGYVFVHAGLSTLVPVDAQLKFLHAKDISRLRNSGYQTYKGGLVGMPDQITNKSWARTNSPAWERIVVTGHNKYESGRDFVASHRLGLHSCACERTFDPELPLHCALLRRGAADLTLPSDAPKLFSVR